MTHSRLILQLSRARKGCVPHLGDIRIIICPIRAFPRSGTAFGCPDTAGSIRGEPLPIRARFVPAPFHRLTQAKVTVAFWDSQRSSHAGKPPADHRGFECAAGG